MSIYMKIATLNGGVTDSQYQGAIALQDFRFGGITNHVESGLGKENDRINTAPSIKQIWISKQSDASSIDLFQATHQGRVFKTVEIDFVSTGKIPFMYEKIKLSNVIIGHFSVEHDETAQAPMEFMSLAYTSIERTYVPRDRENKAGSPVTSGYDIAKVTSL